MKLSNEVMENQVLCRLYSEGQNEVIITKFIFRNHTYIWNESDCVYYDETEGDESYLMDCPFDLQFE